MASISLKLLPDLLSVHQFPRNYKLNASILDQPWFTLSKTSSELSLILPAASKLVDEPHKTETDWRCFQVDAQMDFGLVGILATIVDPLRDNKIPVFVVSTYDTDYVLVKDDKVDKAASLLIEHGMKVSQGESVLKDSI
ncbi:ACT domain-containing protein [Phycomyces nitens]|nr:ACT domain-containing protein [Phycomyces nitens]